MCWKNKVLQDAKAKLSRSFFLVTRTMLVLFVLRFYHPDKTDKINRSFNPLFQFKTGRNDKQSCQKADVCIKIVSSYRCQYSLFSDP